MINESMTEFLNLKQKQQVCSMPSIQPRAETSSCPLSYAQNRLWFLHQLAPDNPFYNMPAALRLQGELNQTALQAAFNQIVKRHEALRTNFTETNGQPIQLISPPYIVSIPLIDLTTLAEPEKQLAIDRITTTEAKRPFRLNSDRLLRVTLLQL